MKNIYYFLYASSIPLNEALATFTPLLFKGEEKFISNNIKKPLAYIRKSSIEYGCFGVLVSVVRKAVVKAKGMRSIILGEFSSEGKAAMQSAFMNDESVGVTLVDFH